MKILARAAVLSEGSREGRSAFKLIHVLLAGLGFSPAIGWKHHFIAIWASLYRAAHNMKNKRAREGMRDEAMVLKLQYFCNLVLKVIAHCLCPTLFVRKESQHPAYTQRERIYTRA